MVFPISTFISGIFYATPGDQFDATKLEGLTTRAVIVLPRQYFSLSLGEIQ
jgi:peroxiredoxin